MSVEDRIRTLVSHFARQIQLVSSLTSDPSIVVGSSDPVTRVALHKKILFAAIIDSLSAIRFKGKRIGNCQRFIKMLQAHSGWREGNLVSVPVAAERLRGLLRSRLKTKLEENLSRYGTDRGNSLPVSAFDESLDQLRPYAEGKDERKIISDSQHFALFYRYRNYVVHEFREPGYAMETFADGGEKALYHSYLGEDENWCLLYPVGLFRLLASNCLESLRQYLEKEGIDPFTRVKDSQDWNT